jgi:NMD protein affecting ribosome stability and mRNA decay
VTYLCPVCGKQIKEIRPIVYECDLHGEFTLMEIVRAEKEKGKR